ncbi:MAG: NAD(P)-dependent oxidoreductase [Acetobacterales bacterium]
MTAYLLDRLTAGPIAALRERVAVVNWDEPGIQDWHEHASAVVVRSSYITADDIAKAKRLKLVCKHGVGTEKVALDAAREHGVMVTNVPGGSAQSVAELALGLTVAVARPFALTDRRLRAGLVEDREPFHGQELKGRTLGIAALGELGQAVLRVFRGAFGMDAIAWAPRTSQEKCEALGARKVETLDELLAVSDVLVICVPQTPETIGLFGETEFRKMKSTAIAINVSRGAVWDEVALDRVLASGHLLGAGADVFTVEPPPADHPLVQRDNFVAAPHMGAMTEEALDRVGYTVVEQVAAALSGGEPKHRVA